MTHVHSEWYGRNRPDYFVAGRSLGTMDLLEVRQPAGVFPDPPLSDWSLQLSLDAHTTATVDVGDGPFQTPLTSGGVTFAPPDVACDYQIAGDHSVFALNLPKDDMALALSDTGGPVGQFGQLHSCTWRDNAIRDLMLTIWRASKGDRHAPDLDPDEALMRLALMLLKRANEKFTPKDFAYRLAPAVRRRVTEFVNDHIDEDLPLFRLAEVAGLSPFHFARAFRADMGDTPAQYVTRRRLAKAQDLIRDTDRPFTEIAMEAGFSSQSRLNDAFAREIGGTPTQMRREVRG